ncbi:hypothetical protein LTR78_006845 [Recurvomyces mirabilis]|uniref:UBC core domain-containing protein n=1 Tax=Recurvomyces mirabilis TaxID=574656 RepID=A0AAE0WKC9_9PEZI|nr:hypothetical protein LTR78_006845 [Recurvomyces mirabilis]KAK5153164.1 hypothetical protein LTS14_007809 [Recurvomyces mirabilis]
MESTLHSDDIVASLADDSRLGVVERTHADVDTHEPHPQDTEEGHIKHDRGIDQFRFRQFLKEGVPPKGAVLVRWQNSQQAQLMPADDLKVLDRSLLIGDVVKKNVREAMSGVVINTHIKCMLQPIYDVTWKGRKLRGLLPPTDLEPGFTRPPKTDRPSLIVDVPASELQESDDLTEESLIIYKNRIGRVYGVIEALTLKLTDNCVVEVINDDDKIEHADGAFEAFTVGDVAVTKKGELRTGRWIFGQYNPNTPPVGTIVESRPSSIEVEWLQRRIGSDDDNEPPTLLERDEIESNAFKVYDRTRRPRRQTQLNPSSTPSTISQSEIDARLNQRVRFRDLAGACMKYDGSTPHGKLTRLERSETLGYDLNVFDIERFETSVEVQWQDLTITTERSVDLVPDSAIDDEHSAWPGEIAHTLDITSVAGLKEVERPGRVGVVQSVNAEERMAKIRWAPDAVVEYAVGEKDDDGSRLLLTGAVGLATGEVEEVSLYDLEAPGVMNVRRGDIVLVQPGALSSATEASMGKHWLGEVVDTCLDGTLTIRLGAADDIIDVRLKREQVVVAVRSDGTPHETGWEGEDEDMEDIINDYSGSEDMEASDEEDSDGDSWSDDDEMMDAEAMYEDENGLPLDEDDVINGDWESEDEDETMPDAAAATKDTPPTSTSATPPDTSNPQSSPITSEPPQYLILETPPPKTHHYASQIPTFTPAHTKATQKTHLILQKPGALPPGIYVRTWSSRLDLLRILILGPSDTPYASCPFLIDLYLPPTYPTEAPKAFFHSFPAPTGGLGGGEGKVNPNLYEDGTICLSLLGTWEGRKGEGWVAGRSTVLQVLVSLLGLVLVREPYFNEAGYEHLVGLESSRRASALYSERVLIKARGFVVTALERLRERGEAGAAVVGLEAVEDVVQWLYLASEGPRMLEGVVKEVEGVLERSAKGGGEPDGVGVLRSPGDDARIVNL